MFPIVKKRVLNETVTLMEIEAPLVARKALPGQFIIFRIDEEGERIPLTIAGYDREKGTVTIIFQKVGYTTMKLDTLNEGDALLDFVGPLGEPSHTEGVKRAAVIGLAADAPEEAGFLREIGCDVHYYDGKKRRFEIRGTERADTLVVDGTAEPADVVFILRAGFAADTLLPGLATDNGHIVVDDGCAASIPGVFAAGDCTGAPYQIPAAVGEGNRAALSVVRWLRNA